MDHYSRHGSPFTSRTFLLPQAFVVLLSRFVSASEEAVTPSPSQAYTDLSSFPIFRRIKALLYQLLPFADSASHSRTSIWLVVGMVKLTAICGFGSALYIWRKGKDKKKAGSLTERNARPRGTGKIANFAFVMIVRRLYQSRGSFCASPPAQQRFRFHSRLLSPALSLFQPHANSAQMLLRPIQVY